MKLEEKPLFWMPAKTQKLRNKKTQNTKKKKERTKEKKKETSSYEESRPPARQDTQAHGRVPQSGDVAQSVVTLAQGSLYATRKMLKLSVGEASVLV
jgi:hypothetical protein